MTARLTAVLKIGGSLSRENDLASLCAEISMLGSRRRLVIIPGGGEFADLVREYDARFFLRETTAHHMAILAMDQYGCLLSDWIPEAVLVKDLLSARREAVRGQIPVLLPSNLLAEADPLPHSWQVTSDSIAAWIAGELHAPRLILLKDVDGLYAGNPKLDAGAPLRLQIDLEELTTQMGGVDEYLPAVLEKLRLETWVINGRFPHRLTELLLTGSTLGTCILNSAE